MIPKIALLALVLIVAAPAVPASPAHYLPASGDTFSYYETIVLDQGMGNYSGYVEHQWINGTETITASGPGQIESANYSYAGRWADNDGGFGSFHAPADHNFTFNASSDRYVTGTDNQSGYTNPYVWFYINNSLAVGAPFYLLDTQFHVGSRDQSYPLSSSSTGYVAAIAASGSGSYPRNDLYGVFTATYAWNAYFDPATGYIIGYLYTEHDSDPGGNGFTWTDQLVVTHTSYPLASAPAPPAASPGGSSSLYLLLGLLVVIVVVLVVIAVLVRARRRPSLPKHSATGRVDYTPGPVGPPGPPPPSIGLIPSGEPAVQQIVLRETVKVNCRYCGALIDTTAAACPNCGAPRT